MSVFVNRILRIAMGAALMAGTAAVASAQEVAFHLPVEAKWGATMLPPGDYRMTQPEISSVRSAFAVRGPAGTSLILAMTLDAYGARSQPITRNYLQLVKVDGEYFVKKYEDGLRGVTFFFKTPKPNRQLQISYDSVNIPTAGN
jgi:hypothetical protein